jgi:hypothetical protein
VKSIVAVVLGLWLVVVLILGSAGAFNLAAGEVPLPIGIGALGPLLVFLVAYRLSPAFRAFVLAIDLPLATAVQAWRFAGFVFIALAVYEVLPWVFAWPAGLGDMAIGLTAPWMAFALTHRPGFKFSPLFKVWNLLGILDLVVAVTLGALSATLGTGTFAMAKMPLVLVPAYFVPIFVMLHVAALLQARRLASAA